MANEFGPALTAYAAGLADPADQSYLHSLVPSLLNLGISEGMSGRGMLSALREAGLTIGDKAYWGTLSDVRAGDANVTAVGGLDLASVPAAGAFSPWTGTRQSGFYYQFNALFTRPGVEEGTTETISKLWGYVSKTPLTIGDALDAVTAQILDAPPELADQYPENFTAITLENLYEMIPGG